MERCGAVSEAMIGDLFVEGLHYAEYDLLVHLFWLREREDRPRGSRSPRTWPYLWLRILVAF
jgi:hypothetical protein